jgi:hypothetical protein
MYFPAINITCSYNASGKVLILPIAGSGDAVLALSELNNTWGGGGVRASTVPDIVTLHNMVKLCPQMLKVIYIIVIKTSKLQVVCVIVPLVKPRCCTSSTLHYFLRSTVTGKTVDPRLVKISFTFCRSLTFITISTTINQCMP